MILRDFFISGSASCCQSSSFFVRGGKHVCPDHDVSSVFLICNEKVTRGRGGDDWKAPQNDNEANDRVN